MTRPVVVLGSAGQVGSELVALLEGDGSREVVASTRSDVDLEDLAALDRYVRSLAPSVIVNCAAYNAVDRAETETDRAMTVNGHAVGALATAAADTGCHLVHVSTDYVFDGEKGSPYVEDDAPAPLSAYGRSKLAGEVAAVSAGASLTLVRTAWVFGRVGRSLVEFVLESAVAGRPLRMVDDQLGTPTCARDLAVVLARLAENRTQGLFHVANEGSCTPFGLASAVCEVAGVDAEIEAVTTPELGRAARRPRDSRLASTRAATGGLRPMRTFREALAEVVPERLESIRPVTR